MGDQVKPVFLKPRPVPYALQEKVEYELKQLEKEGVLTKTDYSDWGSPLVAVPKANGELRLCFDYKTTVNPHIKEARYPIPRIEDIFNKTRGGQFFSTLDIHRAFHHLAMDEESRKVLAVSTHLGTYFVNKLPFGIKIAPNEFQKVMDNALHDLDGTAVYFDDIIIQGQTQEECKQRVIRCLQRLQNLGLHVNLSKCQFFKTQVEYLGHTICKDGLKKSEEKVKSILEAKQPTNTDGVKSFCGLVMYYSKFIPHVSTIMQPITQLLTKGTKFVWNKKCEDSFKHIKKEITSNRILVAFNPRLPVTLATDASPVGLAGVLSHIIDGEERPIAFISRTLTSTEQNYSQLDKEATAVYWCVKRFFQYLYGRKFTLIIDNKPLQMIFHPGKTLPTMTAGRLMRYAAFLSGFNYNIEHRKSELHANADYLSRTPIKPEVIREDELEQILVQNIQSISSDTITSQVIKEETDSDPDLHDLKGSLLSGAVRDPEFCLQDGIIFRGVRVVIPKKLQPQVLQDLHDTHTGVVKMKALARRYCYWKNIDKDIEATVRSCRSCCEFKSDPRKAPLHVWDEPSSNWQRVHMDYAGPYKGNYYLILVDAKSKWPEIAMTATPPTTTSTIIMLREIFSRNGLPEILVSDNATLFTSSEFQAFCKRNGMKQRFIAPGHPATNGLAERYVQTFKRKLKSMTFDKGTHHEKFHSALFRLRITPLESGKTPAELFMGRTLRSKLDMYKPTISDTNQAVQPSHELVRHLPLGARVQARNYTTSGKWRYGTVVECLGKLHYLVELDDGYTIKRHIDQLQYCEVPIFAENNRPLHLPQSATFGTSENGSNQQWVGNHSDHQLSHPNQRYLQSTVVNKDSSLYNLPPTSVTQVKEAEDMQSTAERNYPFTTPGGEAIRTSSIRTPAQPRRSTTLTTPGGEAIITPAQPRRSNRDRKPVKRLDL